MLTLLDKVGIKPGSRFHADKAYSGQKHRVGQTVSTTWQIRLSDNPGSLLTALLTALYDGLTKQDFELETHNPLQLAFMFQMLARPMCPNPAFDEKPFS
jgi:hypothetical protein